VRFWIARAAHGFLLGAGIAILDVLYYLPLLSAPGAIGLGALLSSLTLWCGECVLFALALGLAERRASPGELRAWQLGLAVLAAVAVSVLAWHAFSLLVLRELFGMRPFRDHLGQPGHWAGAALYHAWLMLFFGGLSAAVGASQRVRARMLTALRSAQLGRATSQRRLAEAGLASLEERVSPDYLYDTLSRLERLYEVDPPAADRLLEELIDFLRKALAPMKPPIPTPETP
jgi:hypothetical protein